MKSLVIPGRNRKIASSNGWNRMVSPIFSIILSFSLKNLLVVKNILIIQYLEGTKNTVEHEKAAF